MQKKDVKGLVGKFKKCNLKMVLKKDDKVNTSEGFKLCPADKCNFNSKITKFKIIKEIDDKELVSKLIKVTENNKIDICGIEFIKDKNGVNWTYDLNCNTNYNTNAEDKAGIKGQGILSLIRLLQKEGL